VWREGRNEVKQRRSEQSEVKKKQKKNGESAVEKVPGSLCEVGDESSESIL
jgi:hypothetical protein